MATSSLDKQILIWDVEKKQDLDRQKFSERISCMAWKPKGNALAVIDVMGKYGVWESPVPLSMKSPTEDIPCVTSNGLLLFDEEEEASASESLSDLGEDSNGESELLNRKRLREDSTFNDSWEEDVKGELDLPPKVESHKKASNGKTHNIGQGKDEPKRKISYSETKMQEAFQPGATPVQPGKRRFLCYNMLGSVTTMDHDGYSHIEVLFPPLLIFVIEIFSFVIFSIWPEASFDHRRIGFLIEHKIARGQLFSRLLMFLKNVSESKKTNQTYKFHFNNCKYQLMETVYRMLYF